MFTPSADAAGYPGGRSCSTSYYPGSSTTYCSDGSSSSTSYYPGYSNTYYSGYGYGG